MRKHLISFAIFSVPFIHHQSVPSSSVPPFRTWSKSTEKGARARGNTESNRTNLDETVLIVVDRSNQCTIQTEKRARQLGTSESYGGGVPKGRMGGWLRPFTQEIVVVVVVEVPSRYSLSNSCSRSMFVLDCIGFD